MKKIIILTAASLWIAASASAATLSVSSDAASYGLGDTITLTVTGDAEGASAQAVFARVLYSGSGSVSFSSATQVGMTSFGGGLAWSEGVTAGDATGANALNQLAGLMALAPDTTFSSTVVLTATGAGTVSLSFEGMSGGPTQLDFFGLSSGSGGSFTIVPEPTTAGLLGLGLLSLAVASRRR